MQEECRGLDDYIAAVKYLAVSVRHEVPPPSCAIMVDFFNSVSPGFII